MARRASQHTGVPMAEQRPKEAHHKLAIAHGVPPIDGTDDVSMSLTQIRAAAIRPD
jgi:hypothetical protein